MQALAGLGLLGTIAVIIAGVFVSVLSIVTMVKVLQIAEDLRYLRSRNDVSIQRPKPYKDTLKACLLASVLVIAFFIIMAVYGAAITR